MPLISWQHLRRLSGAALLLAPSVVALAQRPALRPGYVVLAAAPTDTLRGAVDLRGAGRAQPRIRFRAARQEVRAYPLAEVLAAGDDNGQHYRRVLLPQGAAAPRPALLRVLVAGPASLYQAPTQRLLPDYYLDKPGQPAPTLLTRRQLAPVLQAAFADCPTANTTVVYADQYEYSPTALRRYVLNYNRCRYPGAIVRAPDILPVKDRVQLEAQIGLARVYMIYPYTTPRVTKAGPLSLTGGLLVNLPLINNLSIVSGLTATDYRSDNTFDTPVIGTGYTQINHFQTKGALLRWPLLVRATARRPAAVWRPYAQLGIQMSYLLASELRHSVSFADPNSPLTRFSIRESMDGLGRGYQGEAGVRIRYGAGVFGAGVRYDVINGFPVRGRLYINAYDQLSFALTYTR